MKLSKATKEQLANYATINNGIVLNPGNHIMTRSANTAIHAEVEIEETIEEQISIIDLKGFLSMLNIAGDDAEITVSDESTVSIKNSKSEINWDLAEPDMIVVPPKRVNFPPNPHVSIDLSLDDYNQLMRVSRGMSCDTLVIQPKSGKVVLACYNKLADTELKRPLYVFEAGDFDGDDDAFKYIFNISNLKLIPNSYKIDLWSKGEFFVSKWGSESSFYIIAVEADSKSKLDA